jgi:Phasin protein
LARSCGKSSPISGEQRWRIPARRTSLRKAWKTQPAAFGESAAEQTTRIGQAAADQTARVGQAAAEAGEEVARASANLLKQNVETLQNAWRLGLEAATLAMGRSTEQFGRTLGVSGEGMQQATKATERSARNAQKLLYTGIAAAGVVGGMSQEYFQMSRHQVEKNMDHMNELWSCRTPQDFAVVQSDMVRETVRPGEQPSHSRHVAQNGRRRRKADQTKYGRDPAHRLTRACSFDFEKERLLSAALAVPSDDIDPSQRIDQSRD